jgi:hypothetical protein
MEAADGEEHPKENPVHEKRRGAGERAEAHLEQVEKMMMLGLVQCLLG